MRGCMQAGERQASERCVFGVIWVTLDGPSVIITGLRTRLIHHPAVKTHEAPAIPVTAGEPL